MSRMNVDSLIFSSFLKELFIEFLSYFHFISRSAFCSSTRMAVLLEFETTVNIQPQEVLICIISHKTLYNPNSLSTKGVLSQPHG